MVRIHISAESLMKMLNAMTACGALHVLYVFAKVLAYSSQNVNKSS